MIHFPKILICILGLAISSAAFAQDPEITHKTDKEADFDNYKTYGFVMPEGSITDAAPDTRRFPSTDAKRLEQGEATVRKTVRQALTDKGYVLAEEGQPDFYIGYDALVIGFGDPLNMASDTTVMGQGQTVAVTRKYSMFDSGTAYEGRLSLFIVDAKSRQIVWVVTAEGRMDQLRRIENNAHNLSLKMMEYLPDASQ